MKLTSLLVVLVGLGTGCTVGLVDETKPIEALDTAATDTADVDTEDTEDSGPDNDANSENPFNGECGDGLDNDGDGKVDCNDSDCVAAPECNSSEEKDTDGDGYPDDDDCNPYNPYVNPGAQEVDNNGIDDDCDGFIDASTGSGGNGGNGSGGNNPQAGTVCSDTCVGDPLINIALQLAGLGSMGANNGVCEDGGSGDLLSPTVDWIVGAGNSICPFGTDCTDCGVRIDADGDFHEDVPFGLAMYHDCDDTDPTINSSATDIPGDGIDQDCDGSDASSSGGGSGNGSSTPSTEVSCENGIDEDQDNLTDCNDPDCANDPVCNPETDCSNSLDDDGDGFYDCADSDCTNDPACQTSSGCTSAEVEDCNGNCAPASWAGDGYCDDGAYTYLGIPIYLDCVAYNYDDGDCSELDCTNGLDDDGDGQIDCSDSDCNADPACQSSGGGSSNCDPATEIEDCNGICLPAGWVGDGICDHNPNPSTGSVYGNYSLMCPALNWDDGDCPNNNTCSTGEVIDCDGNCTSESTLGSGTCDPEFDCQTWFYDNGDC